MKTQPNRSSAILPSVAPPDSPQTGKNTSQFIPGKVPSTPLEKIAISLSGGGYRAASFHLGGMSYLDQLHYNGQPLLKNVSMISTVSGGTIPGVVYTLMLQQGKTFIDCYHFLLEKLESLDLIATGIHKLNPEQRLENPYKAKNLINAFAQQYDQEFTLGATLKTLQPMKGHLKAVCFNATEFTNAINFRFRNPDPLLKTGNSAISVPKTMANEIKLSDVIASSSCFPGGFEPLLWPDDYRHENSPALEQYCQQRRENGQTPIGIMDGGIYDNQGVESILIYKDGLKTPHFDLIIVSDVASPDMNPFLPFNEQKKQETGWQTLTLSSIIAKFKRISSTINMILICSALALLLLPISWGYSNSGMTGACITLALVSTMLLISKFVLLAKAEMIYGSISKRISTQISQFYLQKLSKLQLNELSVHRVMPLIANRLNSLLTLLSDVFLKVIRRLNYKRLYEQPNYQYRRATTLIKELTQTDWEAKHAKGKYDLEIGPSIKAVVEQAASFGTTLWFTEDEKLQDMLQALVITGQVTMCYNIKKYLEELVSQPKDTAKENGFKDLAKPVQDELLETLAKCTRDWEDFKSKPGYLFQQLAMPVTTPTSSAPTAKRAKPKTGS